MASWKWSGDRALLRTFGDEDIVTANRRALALAQRLRTRADITDVVPGARSVLVILPPGTAPTDDLIDALEGTPIASEPAGARHEVPVTYDGQDLQAVADRHQLSTRELIVLHSSVEYTVGFNGFAPGFAYLLGLPERLHTPRFATPRTRVPAGSVGIGGAYTGIYPRATPGGWRLIGHSDVALFDARRDPPALLRPGDRVRFVPV